MSFLLDFWQFLRIRKKYWLFPISTIMALFGALVLVTHGSTVAPFIYALF